METFKLEPRSEAIEEARLNTRAETMGKAELEVRRMFDDMEAIDRIKENPYFRDVAERRV